MKRRQFFGLVGALGAAAAGASCGVPSRSKPERVGAPPNSGPQPGPPALPPAPEEADSAVMFVANYLQAAAGANYGGVDQPNSLELAQARTRKYLDPAIAGQWQPGNTLKVVRASLGMPTQDGALTTVKATLTVLGTLMPDGWINPAQVNTGMFTVDFTVSADGERFQLAKPPPSDLLLSDVGLLKLYDARNIYFWDDTDADARLMPDRRYLPRSVNEAKRPAEVLRWLQAGPAVWLQGVAQPMPALGLNDASVIDGKLVVNFSSKANSLDKDAQRQIARQLRWSFLTPGGVDLRIEGTSTAVSTDDYQGSNPGYIPEGSEPARFGVVDGKVVAIDPPEPIDVLGSDLNAGVVRAAIAHAGDRIALVRSEPVHNGKPRHRLWLGSMSGGAAGTRKAIYAPTTLTAAQLSRPVWLSRPAPQALVVANGVVYTAVAPSAVSPAQTGFAAVQLPKGLAGAVTALSVSPEGHRIALVAGGSVVVAPLAFDDGVRVSDAHLVPTDVPGLSAVAWINEMTLLVTGSLSAEKTGIATVCIDGTNYTPLKIAVPRAGAVVDLLSAWPDSADDNPQTLVSMLDIGGLGYRVYTSELQQMSVKEKPVSAPFFLDWS